MKTFLLILAFIMFFIGFVSAFMTLGRSYTTFKRLIIEWGLLINGFVFIVILVQ